TGEFVTINGKNILCDGKICGKGRSTGGRYICPHNNLKVKFPELIEEWSHENEGKPENYAVKSNKKILWECKNNWCGCHKWYAKISDRTRQGRSTGCPFCSAFKGRPCPHNNLKVNFPEIAIEFDARNKKKPEDYLPCSGKKVLWKCKNDPCGCHEWYAVISNRTGTNKTGCPYCSFFGGKPCKHNNLKVEFPDIASEWDPSNEGSPEDYLSHSNKVSLWKCKNDPCGCHSWSTKINNRTKNNGTGCPHCVLLIEV